MLAASSSSSQVDAPLRPALSHYKVRSPAQPIRMHQQASAISLPSQELSSSSDKSSPGTSSFDDTLPPTPCSASTTFSITTRKSSPSIHIEEYYPGMAIGDRAFGDPDQISLYQQTGTQHMYTSTGQKSPYKSMFDLMKPAGRTTSSATSISEHSQEGETTSTHTRSSLPKQPRAMAASKWTQLEFISHPPPSSSNNQNSSRKFLSSRSIPNLRGKTQNHGALKLVVKAGHTPGDLDGGDTTSVFTTVTTSSTGSGDNVILPYGRGGAARAPSSVETRIYGDCDDPAEIAYMDQPKEVKSGKSGGKQFVQGLFGKKDKSLANLSVSVTSQNPSSAHASRNASVETISAQSTHSGRSVHSDDCEQYNAKAIMYGRGGAGRKESKSTRLQHIQEEKEVLAQIAAEQKAVEVRLKEKLPAYGRGGAARTIGAKTQKGKGTDDEV